MTSPLGLDGDDLAACVGCGLCLPHCPTWRAGGQEARSPRGRIDAMRLVESGVAPPDAGFAEVIDSCVGCLGCETACPSGVRYGGLLQATTDALAGGAGTGRPRPWWERPALRGLAHPSLVRAGVTAAALAQRIGIRAGPLRNLPLLPLRRPGLHSTGSDVVLLTGCVMDAAQRRVHRAAIEVLAAADFGVTVQPRPACCGALAAHRGHEDLARSQLEALASAVPPGVAVLSDSAGCAAAVHEGPGRWGGHALEDLAERTEDVCGFLLRHEERLPPPRAGEPPVVALAVPCHMRNVLGPGAVDAVAGVLGRYVELRATADDDICCGAGGSHSVLRPAEAAAVRGRKVAAIEATGAAEVASANPGCAMHLEAAGLAVSHPVEIIARQMAPRQLEEAAMPGEFDGR